MKRIATAVFCLLVWILCLAGTGCGKKGAPFLPEKDIHLRVVDLKAVWEEGVFLLSGRFDSPDQAKSTVSGCRVYFGRYPLEKPPCETCPIEFHGYHGFGPEVVQQEGFFCKVPGKDRGQVYFFKVHLIGADGRLGPASNRVRVAVSH